MPTFQIAHTARERERVEQSRRAREREAAEQQKKLADKWAEAVGGCSGQARRYDHQFQAFVPISGRVEMLGTAQARYAFSKCMADGGFPIQ